MTMMRSSLPYEASPPLEMPKPSPPHRSPSQAPSFNIDIFLYIARILETEDLLHLIQTCRALYVAGIPLLARHIELRLDFYIESDKAVADILSSFCSFFEADDGRRCRYLHVLDIIPTYHDDYRKKLLRPRGLSENLVRLARVLQQCTNMRHLALRDRTAEEFVRVPALLEALGSLQSLRQVAVYQDVDPSFVYSDAIPVLQSIVSPVTSVYLDDGRYNDHDNKDIECRSSVVEAFGHLSSGLEVLHVAHPAFDDEDCDSLIFPKLTYFTTGHSILGDLVTSRFMRMFPQLQVLSLGALSEEDSEDILHDSDSHPHDELRSIREKNEESQKEDRWVTLDAVNADILTLYALALVGPIRHVELLGILKGDKLHLDMWSAILRDSLASTVTICLNTGDFDLGLLPSIAPRTHPLTHLDLTIVFDSERGDRDRRMFWRQLGELCKPLPLTLFNLETIWAAWSYRTSWSENQISQHDSLGGYLLGIQPLWLGKFFSEIVPTLRYFGLTTTFKELMICIDGLPAVRYRTYLEINRTVDFTSLTVIPECDYQALLRQERMSDRRCNSFTDTLMTTFRVGSFIP